LRTRSFCPTAAYIVSYLSEQLACCSLCSVDVYSGQAILPPCIISISIHSKDDVRLYFSASKTFRNLISEIRVLKVPMLLVFIVTHCGQALLDIK
jgi:hypothetical protein